MEDEIRKLVEKWKALTPKSQLEGAALRSCISDLEGVVGRVERSDDERAYVEAARALWQKDGGIEVDDNAIVSISDDQGAYVGAWVWVSDDEIIGPVMEE